MSEEKYEEGCKGCEPALLNLETGKSFPPEHPAMQAIMGVWKVMTHQEKEAWHEFTCHNSREPQIMAVIERINGRMQAALNSVAKSLDV